MASEHSRWITTAAVGLLAAGTLASCGGNESSPSQFTPARRHRAAQRRPSSRWRPPSPSHRHSQSRRPSRRRAQRGRLGCGTYCQAAGILNGGAGDGQPAVTVVPSGTVTADADGYAPVVLTCNLTVQCQGALVLSLQQTWISRTGVYRRQIGRCGGRRCHHDDSVSRWTP